MESGDQVTHRNDDKHQIALISDKNCLCFSHFVAQVVVIRKKKASFEKELNKTLWSREQRKKLAQHLGEEWQVARPFNV